MEPLTIAAGIAGIAGTVANTGAGLWNTYQQYENQQYQRYQQRVNWQREDNAVQRRVADLRAAGLSPTLAAGSSAQTGQAVRSDAAQMSGVNPSDISNVLRAAELDGYIKTTNANVASTLADRDLKLSQKKYVDEQAEGERIDNITRSARNDIGIESTRAGITHLSEQDRHIAQEIIHLTKQDSHLEQQISESIARETHLLQQAVLAMQESRAKDQEYYMNQLRNLMEQREHMIDLAMNARQGGTKLKMTDLGSVWDFIIRHVAQGKTGDQVNRIQLQNYLDAYDAYQHNTTLDTGFRR